MAFNEDMYRTEELHDYRSKGILSAHGQVVIGNAGIASKYNPIPSILESVLEHPNAQNLQLAVFTLSGHFQRVLGASGSDSIDMANDVVSWFLDPHCHACHGTGLKNKERETCPVCGGEKKYPEWAPAKRGCHEVESLFMWREVQLRRSNGKG